MGVGPMAPASPAPLPRFTYEREPGAASRPLPQAWRRRQPEQTALYAVVQEHLETFLQQARDADSAGAGLPRFIEGELRRYLDCGLLSRGFARLRCSSCGDERLVAFSCTGRMYPSGWSRRAADTAADLVDRLLSDASYRQWVLPFPWALRSRLACDRALFSRMLQVFLRTLFARQRRRGRALGVTGMETAQTGSVSFIQRFTQDLRLFPHVHVVVPDGLFTLPDGATELRFHALPPTDSDVRSLTERTGKRLLAVALRHEAQARTLTDEEAVDAEEALLRSCAAAAQRRPPANTARTSPSRHATSKPLCASIAGFSLHAAREVAAHDRPGLERLCRYGLRAPFSVDRFSLTRKGRVRYELRKATSGGRAELLASLISPSTCCAVWSRCFLPPTATW